MMFSVVQSASRDVYPALIAGVERQFGSVGCAEIAGLFLEAERADFYWESRIEERHLGRYEPLIDDEDEDGLELERIAIIGMLGGAWFVATCIADGDGAVRDIETVSAMRSVEEAHSRFVQAR